MQLIRPGSRRPWRPASVGERLGGRVRPGAGKLELEPELLGRLDECLDGGVRGAPVLRAVAETEVAPVAPGARIGRRHPRSSAVRRCHVVHGRAEVCRASGIWGRDLLIA